MIKPRFATALLLLTLLLAGHAHAAPKDVGDRLLEEHFSFADDEQPKLSLNFQDEAKRRLSLRDFKGKYVLLNVWATWCAPCVKEMPSLDALQAHLANRNIMLIALSEDRAGHAAAASFYQRHGLKNLKVFVDAEGMATSLLKLRGLPTTLLIDPQGHEIGRIENTLDWVKPENLAYLDELTKGQKQP